jgi:hypothetical protein
MAFLRSDAWRLYLLLTCGLSPSDPTPDPPDIALSPELEYTSPLSSKLKTLPPGYALMSLDMSRSDSSKASERVPTKVDVVRVEKPANRQDLEARVEVSDDSLSLAAVPLESLELPELEEWLDFELLPGLDLTFPVAFKNTTPSAPNASRIRLLTRA